MNASELLGGHEVEQLFGRLASVDANDRKALRAIARELEARVAIEERTLYPISRTTESAGDAPSFTVAATVLARMESGPFDPKLAALMDLIDEDVREDDDLDVAELELIGDEIARRVEQAMIASTIAGGRGRRQRADRARVRMAARRR